MWECKYGKEPLDMKLSMLRLSRKWWILLLSAVAGAVLCGGIYFLIHVVYGPMKEYTAQSQYYIDYVGAITEESQYTYYNKETWENLVHTDLFLDAMTESLGNTLSREEINEAISATLLTDVRIVHATVTTHSPEKTMQIEKALEEAFLHFSSEQKEVEEVRIILSPKEAVLKAADVRTGRAAILGAVLFLCTALFLLYLYVVMDDSIYIPIEMERRYGIKTELSERTAAESVFCEQEEGKTIVYVKAGDHNGTRIEKMVRDLQRQEKQILEARLLEADAFLNKAYYATWRFPWFHK